MPGLVLLQGPHLMHRDASDLTNIAPKTLLRSRIMYREIIESPSSSEALGSQERLWGTQKPSDGFCLVHSALCVPAKSFACCNPAQSDGYKISAERFNDGFHSREGDEEVRTSGGCVLT